MALTRATIAAFATGALAVTAAFAIASGGEKSDPYGPPVAVTSAAMAWPPFPDSQYWSTPIASDAKIDPRSAELAGYVREKLEKNPSDAPLLALREYTTTVWVGTSRDPLRRIGSCTSYSCPGVAGRRVRVPRGARPDPASDGHIVFVDRRSGTSIELFKARYSRGVWRGAGGGRFDLRRGDAGALAGSSGATAAKLSLLAGLIKPSEIKRGSIRHAIGVTIPGIGRGRPRCPARANVATTSDASAPVEGTHFQLDPAVDISALNLPRLQRTIAVALQRYGMIVNDNGGKIAFRGESFHGKRVDEWKSLGVGGRSSTILKGIPLDRLRVLAQPIC